MKLVVHDWYITKYIRLPLRPITIQQVLDCLKLIYTLLDYYELYKYHFV